MDFSKTKGFATAFGRLWYKPGVRGLYAILDLGLAGARDPAVLAADLCAGGAGALQLRAKGIAADRFLAAALAARAVTSRAGVPFIVNDRLDVALCAGADGVHLGQDDLPIEAVRSLVPPGFLIGISTHDLGEVRAAARAGADYVGFGPVFATRTKKRSDPVQGLEGLAAAVRASPVPVVAIGGITLEHARAVRATGAAAVAVISDLFCADDLAARARAFRDACA